MMKSTLKRTGLVLALASALMARGTLRDLTHGPNDPDLDGRFWSDLQQPEKITLIEGISLGILMAEGDKVWKRNINISPLHSNLDYVKEMDSLYADPANTLIPISEIYLLSTRVFNGASEGSIKASLQFWRASISKGHN